MHSSIQPPHPSFCMLYCDCLFFNFRSQFTEERIGNAEKTEFDAQFENLCSRADRMKQWTEKMLKQTESMLQPNPGI